MKRSSVGRLALVAAIAVGLATIPLTARAQYEKPGEKPAAQKKAGGGHSMTGCVQKGDEASVPYKLTNVEGSGPKEVEIVGTAKGVDLAPHVGHKVTITGTTVSTKAAAKTEGTTAKKEAGEHHMRVTAIKMVSATCPLPN
jgi:hypothetical protein